MTYLDQKASSQFKEYLVELQNDNKAFESEREILFKESSAQINYLIRQLNRLAGIFVEKNVDFQTLKKESGNWTKTTQNSKGNVFKTNEINIKPHNQLGNFLLNGTKIKNLSIGYFFFPLRKKMYMVLYLRLFNVPSCVQDFFSGKVYQLGYSDQTLRQKLDQLIQREILLQQKFLLFIQKNDERKQKIQQLLQRQSQLKQRDELIQQLQKTLQIQKHKYKNQLDAEISQTSKLQKNKLQSQYNKKISLIKEQYQQKTLQNIKKHQRIILVLKQEKDKSLALMQQEISTLQKIYQQKIKENKIRSPQKTKKISLQHNMKLKNTGEQKPNSERPLKQKAQSEEKLKSANQKIHGLQGVVKKLQIQIEKLKEQNLKLITKVECYQIKNKQQMNRISEKENFIAQKSVQLSKIAQELEEKNQAYQILQKTFRSSEAKLANLNEELRRSKKANEEIRQVTNKNLKNLEKQLDDIKKQLFESKKTHFNLNSQLDSLKHQIKQKQIRIQSIDRQLERTKNYNQILTKQNKSLNEIIQNLGKRSNTLDKIPKVSRESVNESVNESQSPKNMKQSKSQQLFFNHKKSLQNIYENEAETGSQHWTEMRQKINTSRMNRISDQSSNEEYEKNYLGRELILPLKESQNSNNINVRQARNSLEGNFVFNYNSFQTTFSPLISPNYSTKNIVQKSMTQPGPNILSWNPESPIHEIQSLYNSMNARHRQNHENHQLKSDQLIEKMSWLSKEKDRSQRNQIHRNSIGLSSMEFEESEFKQSKRKVDESMKVPKLKPLSRLTNRNQNDGKQLTSPSDGRFLNLSFEENNFFNKSAYFNKKPITSRGRLETYKGGLKGSK